MPKRKRKSRPALEVPAAEAQVRVLLQERGPDSLDAAAGTFLASPREALGAQAPLLQALVQADRVGTAVRMVRAAKQLAAIPQRSIVACLLALPQGAALEEGAALVETFAAAARWPSQAHEDAFRRTARALVYEFLDEALEAIGRLRAGGAGRRGDAVLDVRPLSGQKAKELACGECQTAAPETRGLLRGDSVALSRMEGFGDGLCECEVVVSQPLVIRALDARHPLLLSATSGGAFRIDKLGNRTGFSRMVAAVHCLAEPERDWEAKLQGRLPAASRPSAVVRQTLVVPSSAPEIASAAAISENQGGVAGLNESQQQAMAAAQSHAVSLIQGPPGTGKTATSVQILKEWVRSWKRPKRKACLLATSHSNIAVDNLVEGLIQAGVRAVRLGRPEAARPEVLKHTADTQAAESLGFHSLHEERDQTKAHVAVVRVIDNAEVVCCTAIGAANGLLSEHTFRRVLIDEASQATEPATLVPICRGSEVVVLVGDHCQLPPTVSSDAAARAGLSRSLFERLAMGGVSPVVLRTQYRMHPAISAFPSAHFYDRRVVDGVAGGSREAPAGFPWPNPAMPVCIIPAAGGERAEGTSYDNPAEASEAVCATMRLLAEDALTPASIGLVTPYSAQVRLLRSRLRQQGVPTGRESGGIEVNSVDGFQGREKEVIVISTVRTGALGFVADWRRANVAFTRARRGLIVVCDPSTLARDASTWRPWLHWASRQGYCHPGMPPLPPLDPRAEQVGLAHLERLASNAKATLGGAGCHSPDNDRRSPTPEWKRQAVADARDDKEPDAESDSRPSCVPRSATALLASLAGRGPLPSATAALAGLAAGSAGKASSTRRRPLVLRGTVAREAAVLGLLPDPALAAGSAGSASSARRRPLVLRGTVAREAAVLGLLPDPAGRGWEGLVGPPGPGERAGPLADACPRRRPEPLPRGSLRAAGRSHWFGGPTAGGSSDSCESDAEEGDPLDAYDFK